MPLASRLAQSGQKLDVVTANVEVAHWLAEVANARVQIAPQKQRSNVWPVAIGVGAGGFAVAVVGFLTLALTQGWL